MSAASKLRALLNQPGMLTAPGASECVAARAIERAGFSAVYMTGAGTAAMLGYPDYGLTTLSEMAANAGRIAAAVEIPVIADADTGFGNELNMVRTVREYEKLGVAGMHIEDQGFPKKCGHLEGKEVIALDDYVAKIRAAASARKSPDFLIIARTDSRAVIGFEEAIKRVNAAIAAGADMAFVEAPQTVEEVSSVPKLVKGPCLLNMVWRGKTPELSLPEAEKLGYKLTIVPGVVTRAMLGAAERALAELMKTGRQPKPELDITPAEGFRRAGADEWDRYRTAFREPMKRAAE